MARWPLHPPPLDDELLSSWITRLAAAYHLDAPTFCQSALALRAPNLRQLDRQPPPALVATLAAKTGYPVARLGATTLRRYDGLLFPALDPPDPRAMRALMQGIALEKPSPARWGCRDGLPWLFPREQAFSLQFCPRCVRDDPVIYPRTAWRLALTTVCHRHRVLLRETCHHCGLPADLLFPPLPHQPDGCCLCGAALGWAPTVPAPSPVAVLADRAHEGFTTGTVTLEGLAPMPAETYFAVLRALVETVRLKREPQPWAEACWQTLGVDPEEARAHLAVPFEAQPLAWRVQTMTIVGELLTAWPHRLLASCHRASLPVVPLLRRMQGLPSVMWVPLAQEALANDPPALTRWLLATGQTVPGRGEDPSAWAAAYLTACRRLGMSTQRIRSRSQFLLPPLYSALDDLLFDERVERTVTRALERAKARWWRGLS